MPGFDNDVCNASLLTLDGSGAGAQNVIDIVPDTAIGAVAWHGIDIDGAALDPTAGGAEAHALNIDLSGIDLTNNPDIRGAEITMPAASAEGCDAGIRVDGYGIESIMVCADREAGFYTDGTIIQDADTTGFTAVDSGFSQLINIDNEGSTGGDFHSYQVTATGVGVADIFAVGTDPEVGVIHQHTGVFAAVAQGWKENGGFTDTTAAFDNPGVNVTIFDADDDYIYVGANAVFSEIRVILDTVATRDVFPTFEYSTAGPIWVPFTPVDATQGFTENGIISFDSANLAAWAAVNVNGGNFFYVRIRRTRNNIGTIPIEEIIRILEPAEYYWNEDGEILIASITGVGANFTTVDAGTFDTNVAAAGLEMSATTISADGTDANIDVSITPKGTGVLLTPAIGNAADITAIAITAAGEVTMPLQPAFLAFNSADDADVTGNGAIFTVIYDTEVFDQNADFDGTSTFTGPVTGIYRFETSIRLEQLDALATSMILKGVTSNRTYWGDVINPGAVRTNGNEYTTKQSALVDMDAADTITITVQVSNMAGDTVDVSGAASPSLVCFFSGNLVA